ncbi:MAG: hypothetical protein WEE03_12135 [Chloroflexota bacterium]
MENYSCSACGTNFKSKGELDGHVQREHAQPSQKTASVQEKTKEQP